MSEQMHKAVGTYTVLDALLVFAACSGRLLLLHPILRTYDAAELATVIRRAATRLRANG